MPKAGMVPSVVGGLCFKHFNYDNYLFQRRLILSQTRKLPFASNSTLLPLYRFDFEAAVSSLENECFKKFGKTGKSFYISQVASTVRWLSTAGLIHITDRLQPKTPCSENPKPKDNSPSSKTPWSDSSTKATKDLYESASSNPPPNAQEFDVGITKMVLPPIPSFSEFMRSSKARSSGTAHQSSPSKKHSLDRISNTADKKFRLQ